MRISKGTKCKICAMCSKGRRNKKSRSCQGPGRRITVVSVRPGEGRITNGEHGDAMIGCSVTRRDVIGGKDPRGRGRR